MQSIDFECFIDAVTHVIYTFRTDQFSKEGNLGSSVIDLATLKITRLLSEIEGMWTHNDNSDSENEGVIVVDEECKILNKLILYKYLIVNSTIAITDELAQSKQKRNIVYEIQPFLNKMLNLDIVKDTLMQFKVENNKSGPSEDACRKTFRFIRNLVELFSYDEAMIPTTFNIGHYIPMWMLFLTMKTSGQEKSLILSGILNCNY